MAAKPRRTETWIFAVIFIFLAVVAGLSLYSQGAGNLWSLLWKKKAAAMAFVFAIYAALFAGATWASLFLSGNRQTTFSRFCADHAIGVAREARGFLCWIVEPLKDYRNCLFVGFVTAIALALRAYFLSIPIRFDEGLTYLNFVNGDFMDLFFYPEPNNHVLHTLLVKLSVVLFGNNPVAIRLPALTASLCTIPLAFCLCRRLVPGPGGYLASALMAVFPYLVLYGAMARGYSLVIFLGLFMALAGLRFLSGLSSARCGIICLLAALGIYTMPSFLFPAAGFILWIICLLFLHGQGAKAVTRGFIIPCALVTSILCVLFYTPTIIATQWMHSKVLTTMSWTEFSGRLPRHLLQTLTAFLRDVPMALTVVIAALFAAGFYHCLRNRKWEALLLVPCCAFAAAAILFAKRIIPFERTWIYLIPLVFLFADISLTGIIQRVKGPFARHLPGPLAVLTFFWAMTLACNNVIARYSDVGLFPEAGVVVDFLSREMQPGDLMVANIPANVPVCYYMLQKGVPKMGEFPPGRPARTFFIVQKSIYSLADMTKKPCVKLLELGDAVVYGTK